MNIYVGNLSYSVTEEDLNAMFAEFGDVTSAKLIMDRDTGRSKGFGFVEMSGEDAGQKAMEDLRDYQDSFGTYMNIVCMDKDGETAAFSFAESTTYNVQNEEMDQYKELPRKKINI